jgi:hypothetical protein
MLDGAVQGPDAIRAVIGGVRELYDRQDFNFAGPFGDNGFIEDYTAEVHGTHQRVPGGSEQSGARR